MNTLVGQTLEGRYRLDAPIGEGAMGEVYRGVQVSLERPVAVKLLPVRLLGQKDLHQRFEREARLLSKLKHPGIVSVIDFGYAEGRPYLVMELVDGGTLEDLMAQQGRLEPGRVAGILLELCAALEHAHEAGVLHRDLKPANILIEGPRVRVVDFGVARAIQPGPGLNITGEGMVIGTPKYCSPEQAMGLALDPRSDLYSLGVIGWRMLAGRVPFEGDSAAGIFAQHVGAMATPIAEAASLPPSWRPLGAVIDRLMAKSPDERYPSARATADAIEASTRQIHDVDSLIPPPRDRGDHDTEMDLGSAISELTASSGESSGIEPTLRRDAGPAIVTERRPFVDRHPGLAAAGVVATIALGAWIATSMGAPEPSAAPAPVALPAIAVEARALIERGQAKKAMMALEEAVEASPKSPALRVALGHAYVRGDRFDDAIPHYAWAARSPEVFDEQHRADLAQLASKAKTAEGRVVATFARERLGEPVDVLAAARDALASNRCEDRKAAVKVLGDRKKKDAAPLLEAASRDKRCGAAEAKRALDALSP